MRILLLLAGLLLLLPGLCAAAFTPFLFDPNSFSIIIFFWLPGAILGALGVWALVAAIRGNEAGTNRRVGYILLALAGAVLAVPGLLGIVGFLSTLVYLPDIVSGKIPLAEYLLYGLGGNFLSLAIGALGGYMIVYAIRKLRAPGATGDAQKPEGPGSAAT